MHISCNLSSVLFLLLYAHCARTAFIPTTISLSNENLLGLPILNLSGAPPATGVPPIPVSSRGIVLAFLAKGQPIPENEVKDTLIEADQAVADLARNHPTQAILNDRFEYRRPNGNMLISIKTNEGEEITWMELFRILHALYQYMTAELGAGEPHYQALEFEVEARGLEKPNIGYGVVWYFNPTGSEVQKRVTRPILDLTFPLPSYEITRRLPNTTLVLPGAENDDEPTIFPIAKTSLSLSFHFFGVSIPARSVKATLQGAMAEVRPFLNSRSEDDPIADDAFRWILPLSPEAGRPVAVTIFTYHGHKITWRQLFNVLFGLYAFTTTFGTDLKEPYYQILGFDVVDHDSKRLGVGTISYFIRPETDQLAKRVEDIDHGSLLRRPSAPNFSRLDSFVSSPIVYPVANTEVTLTFTFLGDTEIPPSEIDGALIGALERISSAVAGHPEASILGSYRDISASGRISTNILVYGEKSIKWKELDQLLRGILRFCRGDRGHNRVLVFEIDIAGARRGRVGFGTILYVPTELTVLEERALAARDTRILLPNNAAISKPRLTALAVPRRLLSNNTAISKPRLTALAVPIPYPIPGTPITLTLSAFGEPIPSIYVSAAITSGLRKIQTDLNRHPDSPIPNGRWVRRGVVDKVWIDIVAYEGEMHWRDLSIVLQALLRFMTEAGVHRCRDLGFYFDTAGDELTGYGSVVYYPNRDGSVGREH